MQTTARDIDWKYYWGNPNRRNNNIKRRNNEEEKHQKTFVEFCEYKNIAGSNKKIGSYLLHIANGGMRNKVEAKKLKRLGVKAGVPDLFFAYPCSGYSGLWIEMKSKKGIISKNQAVWIERLRHVGFRVCVCYSCDEAIEAILSYMKGNTNQNIIGDKA